MHPGDPLLPDKLGSNIHHTEHSSSSRYKSSERREEKRREAIELLLARKLR